MKLRMVLYFLMASALLLAGCSAAKLKNSWKADGYTATADRVLVIGVSSNRAARQIFEASTAENLQKLGVAATASYTAFGGETELNEQLILDYVAKEQVDAVLVTKVLDSQTFNQRVSHATGTSAGYPGINPYYRGFDGWYDDYRYWHTNIVTYDTKFIVSHLESSLYVKEQGKERMVWSALVELESADQDTSGIKDLVKLLVQQLKKDGMI